MKKIIIGSLLLVAGISLVVRLTAQTKPSSLTVHEWGTFTSFQGGDGKLLLWKPLKNSTLPKFVYDWNHPGLGRKPGNLMLKGEVISLQRMETPVVYFYSDHEETVNLSVDFIHGNITEWFPQAEQLHYQPVMFATNKITLSATKPLSSIGWKGLRILPGQATANLDHKKLPPTDASGSHYFSARNTDANYVQSEATTTSEYEKFLFYRGTGNFSTPLRVTMITDSALTVSNMGSNTLVHLYVLGIKQHAGNFVYVSELKPGEEKTIPINLDKDMQPVATLSDEISNHMATSLAKSGLFPREARAMVNTWSDSWFTEEGIRVLYTLPTNWTEQTLPMSINPAPTNLVRVMVGRAEVLAPGLEHTLATELVKAGNGDPAASRQVKQIIKDLGRFAEPAFNRAILDVKLEESERVKMFSFLYNAQTAK